MKQKLFIIFVLLFGTGLIHSQSITVTSPNGGETWQIGSAYAVTWASTNISGNVIIQLLKNGVSQGAIYNGPNTGAYKWVITSLLNGTPVSVGTY